MTGYGIVVLYSQCPLERSQRKLGDQTLLLVGFELSAQAKLLAWRQVKNPILCVPVNVHRPLSRLKL